MNLHLTKKLNEKLRIELSSALQTVDELYSWRANYVQEHGQRFVVFMNDATKLTVVINEAKVAKLRKLPEIFITNLRATLLAMSFNPEVVDRYMVELGEITYVKNTDRKRTAWVIKCGDAVWSALRDLRDDVELGVCANDYLHVALEDNERNYYSPKENAVKAFAVYGLPVLKVRAFDLNVRLDLDGRDAVRRLRVPANISFKKLHRLLQTAFDWQNCHLHSFGMFKEWSENYYARPDVELFMDEESLEINPNALLIEGKTLADFVPEYAKILYTYDFGDDWHHYIEVENTIEDCDERLPLLLSGEGDAPPEDVGGPGGFANLLEILAEPSHSEYEHMKVWSESQKWKPFDFELTAKLIQR